jgi:restriction endonuclease S subunit
MTKSLSDYLRKKENLITKNENLFREEIIEPDKLLKFIFNNVILLGSLGFFIVGISSYLGYNLVFFLNSTEILFFPQGITMLVYGTLGLLISINQFLVLYWKIGEGYNEFNKLNGKMTIYRKGYPGKNEDVMINYPLNDILREYLIKFNK